MKTVIYIITVMLIANSALAQNTGIGTITPTERLEVNGNLKFNGALMPNNIPGAANQMLVSAGAGIAAVWMSQPPGAVQLIKEVIGTTAQTITAGSTADITGASLTFTTTGTTTILVTYSALALPAAFFAPVHGSIDLMVDGTKQISSYYSGCDSPNGGLGILGNYSTAEKVLTNVTAGSHTIKLQAKSWTNTTAFNVDPTLAYFGALPTDSEAMKARITVIVLNN